MRYLPIKVFLLFILSAASILAQYADKKFSISINGVYTTTAKIYLTPFSSDPILRNNVFPLSDIFNAAVEFRYRFSEPLILGVGSEYMTTTETGANLTILDSNTTRTITVEDGFVFIPIELSMYYLLPFSTERFMFLIGGGLGFYTGSHLRNIGNLSSKTIERKLGYGIHVSTSVDYLLVKDIFLHFEMKFRDPQFTVKNEYPESLGLIQNTYDAKINIDGIAFLLGIAFQF